MNRKRMLLAILLMGLLGGGWFGYIEYNRKPKDLLKTKADLAVTSDELLKEFSANEKEAGTKFIDKIIAVKGQVKSIEKNEQGFFTVVLAGEGGSSTIRCSIDNKHQESISKISPGMFITVKGACTGYTADELLGSDVLLNRCVVQS